MSGNLPLNITFVTIHPEFVRAYLDFGAFRAASAAGSLHCDVVNLRDFATDKYGSVDDRPYGGGDGMVMRADILASACKSLAADAYIILLSPGGRKMRQEGMSRLRQLNRPLVFICGRFAGIDQRFIDKYVHEEISIGDFVVSGGELPAMLIADAIVRHLPGALGHQDSAALDSFSPAYEGGLEHPSYTRPPNFEGMDVPSVLLSGDHQAIAEWRREQSRRLTQGVALPLGGDADC